MEVSTRTIKAIGRIITGDEGISPRRSGPQLVDLFVEYGANDYYGAGFPSRWKYAEDKLKELNGTAALGAIVCQVLDPREFLDDENLAVDEAINYVNQRLSYDGYEVAIKKGRAVIRESNGKVVECAHPFEGSVDEAHRFIEEQIEKSEEKINDDDFDGAITNARSLVEAVLKGIEEELADEPLKYDGDLPKLYRRVQRLLNIEPGRADLETSLKQVLSGLNSVINGLSGISNQMGDRHARRYKPSKHHAALAVNAAHTLVNFLYATQEYQAEASAD